ncbi:MAG: hemolysin family protein [Bacteroidales bacterium]|jgi:CBS domain containing-hemolysin-like protein|nr:hemolysin family protein [Bacteroidales bacterium]MDD4058035.1 hemolysin family protein [Bacteroidales bacterium]
MIAAIIIAIAAFVLFFVATLTESALISCNRLRIELDIKQEKRYAIASEKLLENRVFIVLSFKMARAVFAALFTISAGWISLINQSNSSLPTGLLLMIYILAGAGIIIILGTIIPKWIATRVPDTVLKNLYWFATSIAFLTKPLKIRRSDNPSMIIDEEEEESAESEIIHNAINFSDVLLRECMIPRTEVVAISSTSNPEEMLNLFRESNYSRIPVYEGSIDRITGYVHSKDMLEGRKTIQELSRKIEYYPEEMGARDLLATMIKNRSSIAVVLDKYGGTAGIVTLEDLIEEIFGEISDELDYEEFREKELGDGEYIFSARLEIKYLNREYELEIPESDEYETLGGFITWFNENIPSQGEILQYENMQITILRTTRSRLELVRLKLLDI